jgi:hypothetical protein
MIAQTILAGSGRGRFCLWDPTHPLNRGDIPFSDSLTVDLASAALEAESPVIATCESSFATHGANLLRAARAQRTVGWVTGIDYAQAESLLGQIVEIDANGTIQDVKQLKSEDDQSDYTLNRLQNTPQILPRKNRTQIRYNCTTGVVCTCFWPHRAFPQLTYSLMSEGLERNCQFIGYMEAYTCLDSKQQIWFHSGPTYAQLLGMASDPASGTLHAKLQIQTYDFIRNQLSNGELRIDALVDLLGQYFAAFLLFHDTYEHVILQSLVHIASMLTDGDAIDRDELLWCELDLWLMQNDLRPLKEKNLLRREPIFPLPPFGPYEDLAITKDRIKKLLASSVPSHRVNQMTRYLDYYCMVFVAKEWKFIINKILFSRFANALWTFLDNDVKQVQAASLLSWSELVRKTAVSL